MARKKHSEPIAQDEHGAIYGYNRFNGQPIRGYDELGEPIYLFNEAGDPCCGALTEEGTLCLRPDRRRGGRCLFHGGNNAEGSAHGNYKHGKYSKADLRRETIVQMFANHTLTQDGEPLLAEAVKTLHKAVVAEDRHAAEYAFDQIAGKAATRITYKLENPVVFDAFVDAMLAAGIDTDTIDKVLDSVTDALANDAERSQQEGEGEGAE